MRQVNVWYRRGVHTQAHLRVSVCVENWIAHKTLLRIKLLSLYRWKMDDLKWLNELRFAVGHSALFPHSLHLHLSYPYRLIAELVHLSFDSIWLPDSWRHLCDLIAFKCTNRLCYGHSSWIFRFFIQKEYVIDVSLSLPLCVFFFSAPFWQMWYNFYGCLWVLFYGFGRCCCCCCLFFNLFCSVRFQ